MPKTNLIPSRPGYNASPDPHPGFIPETGPSNLMRGLLRHKELTSAIRRGEEKKAFDQLDGINDFDVLVGIITALLMTSEMPFSICAYAIEKFIELKEKNIQLMLGIGYEKKLAYDRYIANKYVQLHSAWVKRFSVFSLPLWRFRQQHPGVVEVIKKLYTLSFQRWKGEGSYGEDRKVYDSLAHDFVLCSSSKDFPSDFSITPGLQGTMHWLTWSGYPCIMARIETEKYIKDNLEFSREPFPIAQVALRIPKTKSEEFKWPSDQATEWAWKLLFSEYQLTLLSDHFPERRSLSNNKHSPRLNLNREDEVVIYKYVSNIKILSNRLGIPMNELGDIFTHISKFKRSILYSALGYARQEDLQIGIYLNKKKKE